MRMNFLNKVKYNQKKLTNNLPTISCCTITIDFRTCIRNFVREYVHCIWLRRYIILFVENFDRNYLLVFDACIKEKDIIIAFINHNSLSHRKFWSFVCRCLLQDKHRSTRTAQSTNTGIVHTITNVRSPINLN